MPSTDLIFPTLTKGIVPPQGIINPCSPHVCHFLCISIYRIEKFSTFTTYFEFKSTSSLHELRILSPVPLCASLNFGMLDLSCYFKVQLSSVRESFVGSWNCLQFAIAVTTSSNLLVLPNCHSGHLLFQLCDKRFESMASAGMDPCERPVITPQNAFWKSKKTTNSSTYRPTPLNNSSWAAWPPLTNAMLSHSSTYLLMLFFRWVSINLVGKDVRLTSKIQTTYWSPEFQGIQQQQWRKTRCGGGGLGGMLKLFNLN